MKTEFILHHTFYEIDKIGEIKHPQIPIAGRSNVGKSSFINCLAGKKNLARTSSRPGKTRSINFYFIKRFKGYLVDLPGYGYAKTSKKEREKWARMVDEYFKKNHSHIKAVILLIDSRISPQEADITLFNYIKNKGYLTIPILTKIDKASMSLRTKAKNFWMDFSGLSEPPILFSAKTSTGKGKVLELIYSMLSQHQQTLK